MKGIVLAGGSGTRLYPLTKVVSKQLLPIYDKPMIYYPLSILMLAGIRDILIISTTEDTPRYQLLLGDGSNFGLNLSYKIQPAPDGLPQAFIIGEKFIGNDSVAMILGDNIFYGSNMKHLLFKAVFNTDKNEATIFGYHVSDPTRFGVVGFNNKMKVVNLEEKPSNPKSNYAITGLYFYDNRVVEYSKLLKPSLRGELEITDLNRIYLDQNDLNVICLGRGYSWMDTGTHESLTNATNLIKLLEENQNLKIACLEEIAYSNKWISKDKLLELAQTMKNNQYGQHLYNVAHNNPQKKLTLKY